MSVNPYKIYNQFSTMVRRDSLAVLRMQWFRLLKLLVNPDPYLRRYPNIMVIIMLLATDFSQRKQRGSSTKLARCV